MRKYNPESDLHIRLLPKDKEKLFQDAEVAGMNASAYVRLLINNQTPKSREDMLQIKKLVYEINQIGTNINQIAAHVNSGFCNEHEKSKLFALMNTLVKNTEEIIHTKKKEER